MILYCIGQDFEVEVQVRYEAGVWSVFRADVCKGNEVVQPLRTRFGQDFKVEVQARFEAGVWSVFCRCCFVEVMKLNHGRDSEARFGQYLAF